MGHRGVLDRGGAQRRPTGRPRAPPGVDDDVGRRVADRPALGGASTAGRPRRRRARRPGRGRRRRRRWRAAGGLLGGRQDHPRPGGVDDGREGRVGEAVVERDPGGARLRDRELRGEGVGGALEQHRDPVPGAEPPPAQVPRQAGGPGVEGHVGQRADRRPAHLEGEVVGASLAPELVAAPLHHPVEAVVVRVARAASEAAGDHPRRDERTSGPSRGRHGQHRQRAVEQVGDVGLPPVGGDRDAARAPARRDRRGDLRASWCRGPGDVRVDRRRRRRTGRRRSA